jgi:hypothetical protein
LSPKTIAKLFRACSDVIQMNLCYNIWSASTLTQLPISETRFEAEGFQEMDLFQKNNYVQHTSIKKTTFNTQRQHDQIPYNVGIPWTKSLILFLFLLGDLQTERLTSQPKQLLWYCGKLKNMVQPSLTKESVSNRLAQSILVW